MPKFSSFFRLEPYRRFLTRTTRRFVLAPRWNLRGAAFYPPGHFYSPLLDIASADGKSSHFPYDGAEYWEHVSLRSDDQRQYYEQLLEFSTLLPFPTHEEPRCRYFSGNDYFPVADAFALSAIIQKEKPRRIVEVGSGFSSAVILDTLERVTADVDRPQLTFIEPFPERLHSLMREVDSRMSRLLIQPVQEVALTVFEELSANDILFIDSSHVAKVGSDVTFLILRVLPCLQPGVIVHFHDIVYPFSYPAEWLREGRAWNESLFLRAFLLLNNAFKVIAFNSYAVQVFPELFRNRVSEVLENRGGSLWLRKVR